METRAQLATCESRHFNYQSAQQILWQYVLGQVLTSVLSETALAVCVPSSHLFSKSRIEQ